MKYQTKLGGSIISNPKEVGMDRCKKCGGKYPSVKYMPSEDRLRMVCDRCEYIWFKDPLDKERSGDEV